MADESALPRLIYNSVTVPFTNDPPRKRVRHSSPPISSDPALFSSDDDPSAENYTKERSKKKFRGPWYRQVPASESASQGPYENEPRKKSKRRFERQFDSGIFLGSDGTDVEEALDNVEAISTSPLSLRQSRVTQIRPLEPSPEELAQGQITKCLEDGNEIIDLSSRGLSALSNATIRPLATFTRVPPVTQGVFYHLEPKLKIFLASNDLTTLPEELFNLDRLTALSLRGNALLELPAHIGRLQNLKELNVSLNALRYLPFEILDLFSDTARIQSIQIHPNPFYKPQFPPSEQPEEDEPVGVQYKTGLGNRDRLRTYRGARCSVSPDLKRSWHPQWKASFQARTDVRYFDNHGTLVQGPNFPKENDTQNYHKSIPSSNIKVLPPIPRGATLSRAPSLLEVALKACAQTPQFPILASLLPEDCPPYLLGLLAEVAAQKESGSNKCTICKRKFIIRRTEWIEWWEISKVTEKRGMASAASPLRQMENKRDVLESMVPLIRRGCSWLCAPEKGGTMEETNVINIID